MAARVRQKRLGGRGQVVMERRKGLGGRGQVEGVRQKRSVSRRQVVAVKRQGSRIIFTLGQLFEVFHRQAPRVGSFYYLVSDKLFLAQAYQTYINYSIGFDHLFEQ